MENNNNEKKYKSQQIRLEAGAPAVDQVGETNVVSAGANLNTEAASEITADRTFAETQLAADTAGISSYAAGSAANAAIRNRAADTEFAAETGERGAYSASAAAKPEFALPHLGGTEFAKESAQRAVIGSPAGATTAAARNRSADTEFAAETGERGAFGVNTGYGANATGLGGNASNQANALPRLGSTEIANETEFAAGTQKRSGSGAYGAVNAARSNAVEAEFAAELAKPGVFGASGAANAARSNAAETEFAAETAGTTAAANKANGLSRVSGTEFANEFTGPASGASDYTEANNIANPANAKKKNVTDAQVASAMAAADSFDSGDAAASAAAGLPRLANTEFAADTAPDRAATAYTADAADAAPRSSLAEAGIGATARSAADTEFAEETAAADTEFAAETATRSKYANAEQSAKVFANADTEEFAAEAAPLGTNRLARNEERGTANNRAEAKNNSIGWFALILAIASLFVWPAILGPAAAIIGFVAYFNGSRSLGVWSIIIGLVSLIAYIALVPYYT